MAFLRVLLMDPAMPLLAVLCLFAACMEVCDAAAVVDVYRLIQFDLQGLPLGSRRAGLNHHGSSLIFYESQPANADLSRTVIVVSISRVNITVLKDLVQSKRLLGGLLLLLPPRSGSAENEANSEVMDAAIFSGLLSELELLLVQSNILYPVYFAFENEMLLAVLKDLEEGDLAGRHATPVTGGFKLVVPVPEPKKLASVTLTNIQGWLPGRRSDGDASQLPTIVIVASYDTFGAAPALLEGSDSNGSGVVALLELARLFSRLYASVKAQGKFNLLFGLTSGGPYNFDGTNKWLRSFDQRLRESIDYAICLNSFGSHGNKLWLHVSKPPESAVIKQIYDGMVNVAGGLGIGIEIGIKHKKINISNSRVAWEHEQFSRQRVTAVTISKLDKAPELLEHAGGLPDGRQNVEAKALTNIIKLVAESLARYIYRHEGKHIEVFADGSSLAVSSSYVELWLDLLSRSPRVAPYLSKSDPIISALKKELGEHTPEVTADNEILDNTFVFYDVPKAELSIYKVASVAFDLIVMVAVLAYLFILFVVLVVTTKSFDDLIVIFRRPPSKKVKAA